MEELRRAPAQLPRRRTAPLQQPQQPQQHTVVRRFGTVLNVNTLHTVTRR